MNMGTVSRKDTRTNCPVTCQGSDVAQPITNSETGPAEDGVDKGPTENGSSSSDLWVSMINVVQDVGDILFLCGHKWPSLYLLHNQMYTTNEASFSEKEEEGTFYMCKGPDYNFLSSKRCLGFKVSRVLTLKLSQNVKISKL